VWGLGLLVVVGIAWAGGLDGDVPAPATVVSAGPLASTEPTAAVTSSADPAFDAIAITWPAETNQLIRTTDLVVRGHVREPSWRVQVVLQSRGAEPIVVRTGGPMTLPGDRDRSPGRTFIVTLPLPDPRPSGPAVVQVVAYDASGRAQEVVLRPVQIGARIGPASGGDTGVIARCHLPDAVRFQRRLELAGSGC
jgi:hypothetical protein